MSEINQTRALAIFMEAIEKPLGERAAFVQSACGGDEALRAEVGEGRGVHVALLLRPGHGSHDCTAVVSLGA